MRYGRVIVPIVFLGCIVLLITSYSIWKSKIEMTKGDTTTSQTEQRSIIEEEPEKTELETPLAASTISRETIEQAIVNADEPVQELVLNRFDAGEQVQMLVVGSTAMDDGSPGYAKLLTDELANTYGSFLETNIASFDGTSKDFIEEKMDGIDWTKTYDLVLYEPFTLNNNGKVKIEDEHKHIQVLEEKMLVEVSDAVLVLQPPYPIYEAAFYLVQIEALEKYAKTKAYPFINHWSSWPSTSDENLTTFLTEDNSPNEEGAKLWASSLITYFTAK